MGGRYFYPGACSRVKIDASQLVRTDKSDTYCGRVFLVFVNKKAQRRPGYVDRERHVFTDCTPA